MGRPAVSYNLQIINPILFVKFVSVSYSLGLSLKEGRRIQFFFLLFFPLSNQRSVSRMNLGALCISTMLETWR